MRNLSYFALNIVFFTPLLLFFFGYFFGVITKNLKYILFCSGLGAVYFFIVDPPATAWKAWEFNYDRTIGVRFGDSVLEELVWAVLVFFVLAVVVSIFAQWEEKGRKFRKTLK